jgi:hypothetical protein
MNANVEAILRKYDVDPSGFSVASEAFGVLTGQVAGLQATDLWFDLRNAFEQTSLWPVIRGEPDGSERTPVDAAATLAAAQALSLRDVLAAPLQKQRAFATDLMGLEVPADVDAAGLAQMLDASGAFSFGGRKQLPDSWPTVPTTTSSVILKSTRSILSPEPLPVVTLSLLDLKHPYEAPAYLGFGGWNDCPTPEIQVAALRDWFQRFGAVPAAMTGDVMECIVSRPPENEADSLELAADQWLFCDDIVSQGTMSVRRLAIELWRQPQWFFWWD